MGSKTFLETIKERLNSKARGRRIVESGYESHELREVQAVYEAETEEIKINSQHESQTNHYLWE